MPSITALLASDAPLVLPGVWDAFSAKLAVEAGFHALFVSGYCLSATRLGEPDLGLLGQAEVVDAAARICAAVDVPVIVDVDTGYGGALNVERTVQELIRVGAAGCFLEDQVWPKRCGHMEGKRIVELDDYLPKLRAALAARGGAPFHVTARTDARAAVGLDEALRRARRFADAGADAVFVEAPESVDEMTRIRSAVPAGVPCVANMVEGGKTPLRDATELAAAGFRMIVVPVAGLLTMLPALRRIFAALHAAGTTRASGVEMADFGTLNGFLGLDDRRARERGWA